MTEYIIELKDVTYTYPDGTIALNKIHMSIIKGKKIAVVGANGAGKSTLFLHFNGLSKPKQGEVYFKGQRISYSNSGLNKLRREVGLVFQEPDHQIFSSSVLQEISIGPMNMGLQREVVLAKSEAAMKAAGVLEFKQKPTHALSYGLKKRVAIASILAMEPSVLVLDEPTSGLDLGSAEMILDILEKLHEDGKTIIISTHDIDMAYSWADYIYVMKKGEVLGYGSPEEVFTDTELLECAGIKQPWIVEVFTESSKGRGVQEALPKSKNQLIDWIKAL